MAEPSDHAQKDGPIVPDENPHAGDEPGFLPATDAASSTQSLSSSVLNYQYENGRRYHAFREGEYFVPNDDREQDRMDLHHHICNLVLGGDLYRAPVDLSKANIVDLGTGTGIWAVEMADQFPKATVTGTDLSPIQSPWVPLNCFFEIDDYESKWDFSDPFDFVHGRNLGGTVRDFPVLLQRAKENMNNGGWIELVDFAAEPFADDDSLDKAPNIVEWCRLLDEASIKFGKQLSIGKNYKQWVTDAGFRNVTEEVYKIPINPWPKNRRLKEIGRYQQANMLEGMEAYTLALLTRVMGWTREDVLAFLVGVREEVKDRSIHIYGKCFCVYGQKDE